MKRVILLIVLNLALCGFVFAKSPLAELDKAREIKLLESNREDVKRILAGFEYDEDDNESYTQIFSNDNAEIEVTFARGDCSNDEEYWNVGEWIVTKVVIEPENDIEVENFRYDFSGFTKEIKREEFPEDYTYHNEILGIVFKIYDEEIESIHLFPANSKIPLLCNNGNTEEILSGDSRYSEVLTRFVCTWVNSPPTVDDVILDKTTVFIGCNGAENSCSDGNKKISVTTVATDKENDPLTYNYEISGGKIIGNGAKVFWDLAGVEPGTYTITAGANDGSGINSTKTQTVVVEECTDCGKEKPQTDAEKQTSDEQKQPTVAEKQLTDTKKP